MIQDINPHVFKNSFIQADSCDEDFVFQFRGGDLLLKQQGEEYTIPFRKEAVQKCEQGIFLFSLDNTNCFLVQDFVVPDDSGYVYRGVNLFRVLQPREVAWASIVAHQLLNWYELNRFCGKCGAGMKLKQDERALYCETCGNTIYPKISPAIIVAVVCKNKILLAKGINFRGGFYSLVAGYADVGESLEAAVVREVKEETGLDVWNIRYYKSSPWPVSGTLMIGFVAEADDRQPIVIDPKEISDAGWFSRDNLPTYPPADISIAGEMIELFRMGKLSEL
ncbi:MAG: NAD(+) diphosphatase [Bacteroidales bacterium]|nr:NAD(+) diphosphatase [Bacteroidales bacterium]